MRRGWNEDGTYTDWHGRIVPRDSIARYRHADAHGDADAQRRPGFWQSYARRLDALAETYDGLDSTSSATATREDARDLRAILLPCGVEVSETWEPKGEPRRFMILAHGFQWGDGSQGEPDRSGAWPNVYGSEADAVGAYLGALYAKGGARA